MNVSQVRDVGSSSSGNATIEDWRVHGKLSLHLSFNYISLVNIIGLFLKRFYLFKPDPATFDQCNICCCFWSLLFY